MKFGRFDTVLVVSESSGLRATWLLAREGVSAEASGILLPGNGRLPIGDGDFLSGDLVVLSMQADSLRHVNISMRYVLSHFFTHKPP